ncbi:MAG: purine-nucleoside phosphorylase [Acholeplasmataceae bacterium]|nr:purine-nucleoside phosphorylase [Acholeplasmataceae bacterium]
MNKQTIDQRMLMINEAASALEKRSVLSPKIGIVLGSGLGSLVELMAEKVMVSYADIPGMTALETEGHAGRMVIGTLSGVPLLAMSGRFHYYDGKGLEAVTFPIRVMKVMGIETLILTNAAGAVNTTFEPGDLMVITDHINLVFDNPLIGPNLDALGPRFPDATMIYDQALIDHAKHAASARSMTLREGVYAWWTGPSYETPAEIRMIRMLGGDAIGMSTVPEALVASHMGMKVLGISVLTNMASGILPEPLSHADVIDQAREVKDQFVRLMTTIITSLG